MRVDVTVGKVVAVLGIPAVLAGAVAAWDIVGWKTPQSHQQDIAAMEVEHEAVNSAILLQLRANRDEWWCDEESETLDDLIAQKDAGDTSEAVEQEILEQREKMADVNCHRFDKD